MNRRASMLFVIALALAGCGERVTPVARPVRFRVLAWDSALIPVSDAVARAESSMGQVIEQHATAEGVIELSLDVDARWDVTFAGATVFPLSILALEPRDAESAIDVALIQRPEALQQVALPSRSAAVFPREATVHRLTVRVRNWRATPGTGMLSYRGRFISETTSEQFVAEPSATYTATYSFAAFAQAPPLELWLGEGVASEAPQARTQPTRGVLVQLARAAQDIEVDLDFASAVAAPPAITSHIQWARGGIFDGATVQSRALPQVRSLLGEWSDAPYARASVGELVAYEPDADTSIPLRIALPSDRWTLDDERGRFVYGALSFSLVRPDGVGWAVDIAADPRASGAIELPLTRALSASSSGAAIGAELVIESDAPQAGFSVKTAANPPTELWRGWHWGAPSSAGVRRFRVPRLPTGISLRELSGGAAVQVSAIASTLAATSPGYGPHRRAAESVRLSASTSALSP